VKRGGDGPGPGASGASGETGRRLWLIAITLGLTACATSVPDEGPPWTEGRMALRIAASADQAAQSVSAGFALRGSGERGELKLSTPLGTLMAHASWSPGMVQLRTPEGEQRFADLDALSRRALGEPLPLAALPDWVAGRPWPAAPSTAIEGGFEQMGWQVQTAQRSAGIVEARRAAAPAVWLRLRIEDPA